MLLRGFDRGDPIKRGLLERGFEYVLLERGLLERGLIERDILERA